MRKLLITIFIVILSFIFAGTISAEAPVAESSGMLKQSDQEVNDLRVLTLKKYLRKHGSPLEEYAEEFIEYADKYNLDWRLVPAISGVESTFGKRIPQNSYNAYGWANGEYRFDSWETSIEVVSKTLREKYLDKGATNITKIARRYAPPSSTWAGKVRFFMRKIEPMPVSFSLEG